MSDTQIFEALESAAPRAKPHRTMLEGTDIPDKPDIIIYRDSIMRFLEEIEDDGMSVRELRDTLDEYR